MKIYTKTGDKGETALFGGGRVRKDHLRIEAYGTVDELNSCLGVARSLSQPHEVDEVLGEIQNDLFQLGADLATPLGVQATVVRIQASDVERLERTIDRFEKALAPLTSFILPGGTPQGAQIHLARAICRRAERCVVRLAETEDIGDQPLIYLNRLSDLLFVMARYVNATLGSAEVLWKSR
jgi:cob(I)alamin adenosyltransferase